MLLLCGTLLICYRFCLPYNLSFLKKQQCFSMRHTAGSSTRFSNALSMKIRVVHYSGQLVWVKTFKSTVKISVCRVFDRKSQI